MRMTELSGKRRIVGLWLPRFSTDRLKRARNGVPDKRPLVLIAKVENAMRLSAVDEHAARSGLRTSMALADARAMIPTLAVHDADPDGDAKLLARLADWCERYSPLVALDPPQGLLLDVTGVTHLFGNEHAMLQQICRAFAKLGFTVQGAIAGTAASASALARYAPGSVVPPGDDVRAIAPLPVAALAADEGILHGLRRAGLKTVGQVAARGRGELAARFGRAFVELLDRTLGKAEHPISPRTPIPDCMAERRFAEPIVTEDIIAETIHALAARISEVLEKRGEGARCIEAGFFRADGKMHRIAIETADPVRAPAIISRLFKEKLDALADPLDPGFGSDLIRLNATNTQVFCARISSFDDNQADKESIARLADRLAARFGAARVLRFHPQDTHIPEAAGVALPAQHRVETKTQWQQMRVRNEAPRRPLRLFARPEHIEVMAEVPDGPPLRFRWRRALHTVVRAEGPERIAMEWWHSNGLTRDYFRIEDGQGRRYWLYRDGLYTRETFSPRWFLHGVFA